MQTRNILIVVGALLPLISSIVYIVSILRGISKPQRTTRLLMALITGISFFALLAAQDTSGIWLALASFIQAVIIFWLTIKFGMSGHGALDAVCFVLCMIGLAIWLATGQSLIGLAGAIIADFIAVVPALVKTWRLPHTESWLFYALDCVAAVFIISAGPYSGANLAYPLYILVINAVFVFAIMRPQRASIAYQTAKLW